MRCKNPNCKDKFKPRLFLQKFCLEKDECIRMEVDLKKKQGIDKKVKDMKPNAHSKENKTYLQNEINKLSRMIDAKFGFTNCIDCDKPMDKQIDACHYHSRGAHSNLRYNLHNLHSGRSNCNLYSDAHKQGYMNGLIERYGRRYAMDVLEFPEHYREPLKLSNIEITEKLAIVRKIIRTFDTYKLTSAMQGRELFNKIIGIYK